jgi:membrane protein
VNVTTKKGFFMLKNIERSFIQLPLIQNTLHWSKKNSLPGFKNVPVYDTMKFFFDEIGRNTLATRANAMTYSFFLSLFPSILVLLTLITVLLNVKYIDNYLQALLQDYFQGHFKSYLKQKQLVDIFPMRAKIEITTSINEFITKSIEQIKKRPVGGMLSYGFLLAIFFSSNGMLSMIKAFDKAHPGVFLKKTGIRRRITAIKLTFLLGFFLIFSMAAIVAGHHVIDFVFRKGSGNHIAANILRWGVIIGLFYAIISSVYRYAPSTKERFPFFTPGATVATTLCILISIVFSMLVSKFDLYDYGAVIGTIIFLLLWMQMNFTFILIGFELNASIAITSTLRAETQP